MDTVVLWIAFAVWCVCMVSGGIRGVQRRIITAVVVDSMDDEQRYKDQCARGITAACGCRAKIVNGGLPSWLG